MQAAVILVVLALLSSSVAVPVFDIFKDKEFRNGMVSEESVGKFEDSRRQHPFGRRKKVKKGRSKEEYKSILQKYLRTYGYIPEEMKKPDLKELQQCLWKFAVWNRARMDKKRFMTNEGLNVLERRLMAMTKQPRCGNPDIGEGNFQPQMDKKGTRVKRYSAQTPWGKKNLTYKIESFDTDLTEEVQRQEIAKAFKLWTDASELTVSEVQGSENADINIKFVAGSHSDSTPFDGPGFVVAHAFYPEDSRVHFDSDEVYTTGGEANKVNLLSVAAHEIGHALGLGHSSQSDAIMYAQYQPYSSNLALAQDDIDGIKYLYPSNPPGECVDEFWCEDILQSECSLFEGYCKKKCGTC